MYDMAFWRDQLPQIVEAKGGPGVCAVRVLTYTGAGDYLVRQVLKTTDGYVSLDTYVDSNGNSPIVSGSSGTSEFDILAWDGCEVVTLPYANIAEVVVRTRLESEPDAVINRIGFAAPRQDGAQ